MIEPVPQQQSARTWRHPGAHEIVKRVASAVVLAGVGVAAIVLGGVVFALIVGVISLILLWEWGRVVRNAEFDHPFFASAIALTAATALAWAGQMLGAAASLGLGMLAVLALRPRPPDLLSAVGVPYIGLCVVGMIWIRSDGGGWLAVLFIFVCVWAHDTCAMVAGRSLGGPRLWPSISPRKTWVGAIGGLAASGLVGTVTALLLPTANLPWLTALGLALGLAAFLGDLAESALKRLGGLKNASSLIPGHGGFLDRLDGAILSFALATVVAAMVDAAAPARALLAGP
jgi:phosphatidate cytidylyltransferase